MGTHVSDGNILAALFGTTRCAVLALFFSRADEAFYLREVARHVAAGLGAVQRELQRLSKAGILRRDVRGRHVYYQANRACPIFPELQSLAVKTAGIGDVLRGALATLANRIVAAFVYGSLAKGSAKAGSDVDLMVIGDSSFGDVVSALAPAQQRMGRDINPTVYPPAEFRRKLAEGHHFLTAVLKGPKVFVLGGEHELGRLAKEQLADETRNKSARGRRSTRGRRP
jgi:predicted nucleotidyltransferase